jgi:hypothetical protein
MNKVWSIVRILALVVPLVILKIVFGRFIPENPGLLFIFLELILLGVIGFIFSFATDFTRASVVDKAIAAAKMAGIYLALVLLTVLVKQRFEARPVIVAVCNYLVFIGLAGVPFARDRFLYSETDDLTTRTHIAGLAWLFISKLALNLVVTLSGMGQETAFVFSTILLAIVIVLFYLVRPVVLSFAVKGYVDHDGINHPVFNTIRVGKSRNADIVVDYDAPRSTFFTVFAGAKWKVNPGVEVTLNKQEITARAELSDGDDIKLGSNSFSISIGSGPFFKRFVLFLTFMFFTLFAAVGDDQGNWELEGVTSFPAQNIDYSLFRLIHAYISIDNERIEKIGDDITSKSNYFIIEGDRAVDIRSIEAEDIPIDLVFVIDKTGSMYDDFRSLHGSLEKMADNIREMRRGIRTGVITFADDKEDIDFLQLSDSVDETVEFISNISPAAGEDWWENPYDALF